MTELETSSTLSKQDQEILESYKAMVDAIGKVFGNSCEVVLHSFADLNKSVIYIHNGEKTGRTIGSPVTDKALKIFHECAISGQNSTDVYFTKTTDGHTMRSTSTVIRNSSGSPIGMLCINFDISTPLMDFLNLLKPDVGSVQDDEEYFARNADDLIVSNTKKVHDLVYADASISTRQKTREIISILYSQGLFKLRDSVNKVASVLGVSKDVIYLHLRALKKS